MWKTIFLFKNFPSLPSYDYPLFGNCSHFIDFFVSSHVAHFGKIISLLTKGWMESMDTYQFILNYILQHAKACNIVT